MKRPASLRPVALAALASAQVCLVSAMVGGCDDGIPGALIPKDSGSFDVAKPDGAGGDGSVDGGADAPFVPDASICSPKTTWAAGTLVPNVSTAQADRFGSVTPDELTIAWMNTAGTVLYADRATTTDPFGAPMTLTGTIALDRVALSADGLTLIVVRSDRLIFAQVTRTARGTAFGTTLDTKPFASLDPLSSGIEDGGDAGGGSFADPVLSSDGHFLYYSVLGGSATTMAESYRSGAPPWTNPFAKGRILTTAELTGVSNKLRRPTGLSPDNRTLFYWDEVDGVEKMGFRDDAILAGHNGYTVFVNVGAYAGAQPTTTCNRIYFDGPGSVGAADLFYADPN
jgi:hypothetical protein